MYDNEYYGAPNDYRNYLSHHGIKGQKWGVMHGPPYPLGSHTSAMIKKGKKVAAKAKNDLKAKSVLSGTEDATLKEKKAKYNRRKDIVNELKQEDWKESMVSDDDRLIFYKYEKSKDGRELFLSMYTDNDGNGKSNITKLKNDLSSITADSKRIHKDFINSVARDERESGFDYPESDIQNMIKAFNSPKSEIHYDAYTNNKSNKYEYSMTMWYDDFGFVKFLTYDEKNKRWNIDNSVSVQYV